MRRAWALAALGWALAGCSMRPPRVGEPPPALPDYPVERAYQATLERYTSHREVYTLLDTRMLAAATYQAPAFRAARVKRQAAFLSWPAELVAQRLAAEEHEAGEFHDVFFGVSMNDPHYENFSAKNTSWRIALVTEAGQIEPVDIERLGRATLDRRAIYPYLDDFWVAYRVRFPRRSPTGELLVPVGAKTLTMRVSSVLGKADFVFPAE